MNNGFGNFPTPNHIQPTNISDYNVPQRHQKSFHYQEKDFPRLSTVEENPQMRKLSDAVQKIQSCVDLLMKQSSINASQQVAPISTVQFEDNLKTVNCTKKPFVGDKQPNIYHQNIYMFQCPFVE